MKTRLLASVLLAQFLCQLPAAPPACNNAAITFLEDFSWLIGSAGYRDADGDLESGSTFQWRRNGTNLFQGAVAEGLLLSFDGSTAGAGGEVPVLASGVNYTNGRFGAALLLSTNGNLRYARLKNYFPAEGTIEMWVALRRPGNDPIYTNRSHVLWHYQVSSSDYMIVAQGANTGTIYAGGVVGGQWQSAYNSSRASMRGWPANEWHHVAFTYSAAGNFMRFYLDGDLVADSNEKRYVAPTTNSTFFSIGCDVGGSVAHYLIDQVRISGRVASGEEIAARARRSAPCAANEVWLPASSLQPGDTVSFDFTPSDGVQTGATCSVTAFYPGIPLTNAIPTSTLLLPGTSNLNLSVHSVTNTSCRFSLGSPLPYAAMTPFAAGAGGTLHTTTLTGLNTDPNVVNDVYVRCAAYPDYLLRLRYRCLSEVNPSFPRKGNLWGWSAFANKPLPYLARIDLWLGADWLKPEQIVQLRQLNPNIRVLTSMNAVENFGLPDDYYLKDIHGNKIEVWPGYYRLNLTKPYVAEHQARYAYQTWLDSGCQADGVFFDNVFLSQSWQTQDIYGNPVQIDADENGIPDNPATFDAAWKAGVLHELATYNALMPHAINLGHALDINEPAIREVFNGISIGFQPANVIEGEQTIDDVLNFYADWSTRARAPRLIMLESSPIDDLAYGYGYAPLTTAPAGTVAFGRDYHPWMRFGLALTLLYDGYFAHEWGDTDHGQDWWYDELDFNLGFPLGDMQRLSQPANTNYMTNGSFESAIASPWSLWADGSGGYAATVTRVTDTATAGNASARINITASGGENWRVDFAQFNRSLVAGVTYELVFWAKASAPRTINLAATKGSPDWRNYGLSRSLAISTNWQEYTVRFTANETVSDSRIQFMVGATTGQVWLDDIRLREAGLDIFRREFDHGLVLLNATRERQTLQLGPGFRRLTGNQAARHQYIVDNADAAFSATGTWNVVQIDSGEWKASGPFYHDWGNNCHQATASTNNLARWTLYTPTNDTYTLQVWWPALPANNWSTNVLYEVLSNGTVVAATNFSQRTGGDQWRTIAAIGLPAGTNNFVRARCLDGLTWIADAVHVFSASRYNDGAAAPSVTLEPMDGIVLQREPGTYADRDGDGLPDFWEQQYFGNPTNAVPGLDSDGDGQTNLQEWIAGTNPTNAASFFRFDAHLNGGETLLSWTSVTGRVYDVQFTTNLAGGFSDWLTGLPATPPLNVQPGTQHLQHPASFYRIRVRFP